jgi:UDP-GlcNAc:undecaprenyl-phosphate/decaprenyl-phosphate GlcNAc-1-phosphate transferase
MSPMADGWKIACAGAMAFLVVTLLVPLCRRFALARGITDGPAQGKFHRAPTPYLGGVAIAIAALASAIVLPGWPRSSLLILVAACLMSVAGLVDDIRGLGATTRLAIEIPAAVVAVLAGARADLFGYGVDFVISVVFLVVLTNAFNLLDNMDGAAGAIGTTIAIGLATAALIHEQVLVGGLAVVLAATCLGFLVYNWHPAAIFMGDAGSLFLGFLLAVIALMLRTDVPHPASAVALVLLVGPALFDTTLVVISRTRSRRRIYVGGTDHTSHRLVLLGMTSVGATVTLVAASALCSFLGVLVAVGSVSADVIVPIVVIGTIVGLVSMLRVGVYKLDAGRGELVARPRSPAPVTAVAPLPTPGAVGGTLAGGVAAASAFNGVLRQAAENGDGVLPAPRRVS